MPTSVTIANRAARTTGGFRSGAQWPPRAGYFIPQKMPLNVIYPRPDAETPAHARHRWAHSQMRYEIPIGVQGGAWPFKYEIISAPAWLSIGQYYGDTNYGVLSGTPNSTGTFNVVVRVTAADNVNTIDVMFTVQSDIANPATVDAQFVFVQAGYAGTKVGTISQPLATIVDWYKNSDTDATYHNKIIVFRQGVYIATGDSNRAPIVGNDTNIYLHESYKTPSLIGFPDEIAEWDMSAAKIVETTGVNDIFIANLTFKNPWTAPDNAHFIWLAGYSNRTTFFDCTFKDFTKGVVGDDNNAPIFSGSLGGTLMKNYLLLKRCTFDNIENPSSNGSYIDYYRVDNYLWEDNIAKNSNTTYGFWGKCTRAFGTIRNNTAIDNVTGKQISMFLGAGASYGGGAPASNLEVCYNNISIPVDQNIDALNVVDSVYFSGVYFNVFVYRNSVYGGKTLCPLVAGLEPVETDGNVIATSDTSRWVVADQVTTVSNYVTSAAASIANPDGTLKGAAGFGTHGSGVQI